MSKHRGLALLTTLVLAAGIASAAAQDFPSKPITIVVPFPPGGVADQATRLVAAKVSDSIGQPVVIDNRPGGGGQVGAMVVKQAKPDGYTLFLANIGSHAINQSLYAKLSYDPVKDFSPVTEIFSMSHVLAVPKNSPAKTPADLVALSKAKPLSFASQGIGSGGHLLGEMFKSGTGSNVVHVPYKGTAQILPDLLAGRLDLIFDGIPGSGPLVRDGNLKGLAVTDSKRSAMLPDVPTMAEAGFPGYELSAWFGIAAPANTPAPVINKLNAEFIKALKHPDVVARMTEFGVNIIGNSPEEFAAVMASETTRLGQVVKASGARAE